MKKLVVLILMAFFLCGCGMFTGMYEDRPLTVEFGVKAATARVLAENPDWKAETVDITDNAIEFLDSGNATTLTNLRSHVVNEIEWETLTPEEQELLYLLIEALEEQLVEHFNSKGVENWEEQQVAVKTVLMWINEVANRGS